jgi:hypothetical protein
VPTKGTLRLRNERIYFLFIFLFVPYILSAGHTICSGLSLVGPALPFQPRLRGGPDLISSAAVVIAKMVMSSLESDVLDATVGAMLSSPLTHAVSCRMGRSGDCCAGRGDFDSACL